MADLPEPFSVDSQAARHALILAEAAARNVLELRNHSPVGELHLTLFGVPDGGVASTPDARDCGAVIGFMEGLLIAEHGAAGTSAVIDEIGFSKKDVTRLKAFECVSTGLDAYVAILRRRKFDGATRSFGSHLFSQISPTGRAVTLIAAASGWRAEQDYLAAMIVPATLQAVLVDYGVLPREGMQSSAFVLADGAWEYPAA